MTYNFFACLCFMHRLVNQDISCLLWIPNVHYHVYKRLYFIINHNHLANYEVDEVSLNKSLKNNPTCKVHFP
jgi:hypothetical protein